jgi:hypothetical protein
MAAILLDSMFDLPSLEGVKEIVVSQQVVEGTAGPLYMCGGGMRAIRSSARAVFASAVMPTNDTRSIVTIVIEPIDLLICPSWPPRRDFL